MSGQRKSQTESLQTRGWFLICFGASRTWLPTLIPLPSWGLHVSSATRVLWILHCIKPSRTTLSPPVAVSCVSSLHLPLHGLHSHTLFAGLSLIPSCPACCCQSHSLFILSICSMQDTSGTCQAHNTGLITLLGVGHTLFVPCRTCFCVVNYV